MKTKLTEAQLWAAAAAVVAEMEAEIDVETKARVKANSAYAQAALTLPDDVAKAIAMTTYLLNGGLIYSFAKMPEAA